MAVGQNLNTLADLAPWTRAPGLDPQPYYPFPINAPLGETMETGTGHRSLQLVNCAIDQLDASKEFKRSSRGLRIT